ncbi:MAG TPA: HAD family hydrolase [Paenibacillaceae bacterium]|nr:HAD family hydrolase [Paenibacillaceae bacterium]
MLKVLLFDWGDTLMRDLPEYKGAMASWPRVETVQGVKEMLSNLSTRYPCYVATNAANSNKNDVASALKRGELLSYFQHIFTPVELKARKPSIFYYKKILDQLQVEPNECAMIGNSLKNDVIPAKKLGMTGIWYRSTVAKIQYHRKGGYWIVPRMDELPKVIRKIEKDGAT